MVGLIFDKIMIVKELNGDVIFANLLMLLSSLYAECAENINTILKNKDVEILNSLSISLKS